MSIALAAGSEISEASFTEVVPCVDYVIRAQWGNKYVVDVTATINCAGQQKRSDRFGVNSWDVQFEMNSGHKIVKFWNAFHEVKTNDELQNTVHVTHNKFSSPIKGKAILYFGFEVQCENSQSPYVPTSVKVNSQVCEVDAYFARELADCAFDYIADQSRSPSPSPQISRRASPSPSIRRCKSAPPVFQLAQFCLRSDSFGAKSDPLVSDDAATHDPTSREASEASTPIDEDRQSSSCTENRNSSVQEAVSGQEEFALTTFVSQIENDKPAHEHHSSNLGKRKVPEDSFSVNESGDSTDFVVNHVLEESPKLITGASRTLKLDYYRRSEQLKKRKYRHMDWVDMSCKSREKLVLGTVLNDSDIVLEPNMFPYDTPAGVSHWTLWSRGWLQDNEIENFVGGWLKNNMPEAVEWNFDDNMSDGLSINLFHVHVYIRCNV